MVVECNRGLDLAHRGAHGENHVHLARLAARLDGGRGVVAGKVANQQHGKIEQVLARVRALRQGAAGNGEHEVGRFAGFGLDQHAADARLRHLDGDRAAFARQRLLGDEGVGQQEAVVLVELAHVAGGFFQAGQVCGLAHTRGDEPLQHICREHRVADEAESRRHQLHRRRGRPPRRCRDL